MRGAARGAVVPLLVALGLLAADAPALAGTDAQALWERAQRSARTVAHTGEVVCVAWARGGPRVETFAVSSTADGVVVRRGAGEVLALRPDLPVRDGETLTGKYRVELAGTDELLGRPTTRLDISLRSGDLRERLWVDRATGLALRRERYDAGRLLAVAAYQRLDLDPSAPGWAQPPAAMTAEPVAAAAPALGLPDELAEGYTIAGAPVPAGPDGESQRVVYDDGLYRVSVFARPGRLAAASLPPGAEPVAGVAGAVEWPGALPRRIVVEAGATTWTLVGDAPPAELRALARALPPAPAPGLADRLTTGFARLWRAMSPFPV